MKVTIFLISVIAFLSSFNFSEDIIINDKNKSVLIVKAINIKKAQGSVRIALYNSKESFMKTPFKKMKVDISESKDVTFEFKGIPKGTYAITIMHDENGNGELDKNFFGMPTEPYGISAKGYNMFGPPNYEDSKFVVTEKEVQLTIKLR